jgi:hypothetical protein
MSLRRTSLGQHLPCACPWGMNKLDENFLDGRARLNARVAARL